MNTPSLTTKKRLPSRLTKHKATHARLATALEAIPNVGASIARDLRSIGIKRPQDLHWPEAALMLRHARLCTAT